MPSKKPCPFIALRAIHGRLAPYESAKINALASLLARALFSLIRKACSLTKVSIQ